jgi:hypothetical protein
MVRAVGRDRHQEKGGRDVAGTIDTKTIGHGLQRRGLVAEPLGDVVKWLSIREACAAGLVWALDGVLGLEEVPACVAPIHDAGCRNLILFPPGTAAARTPKSRAATESRQPSPWVKLLKHRVERASGTRRVMGLRMSIGCRSDRSRLGEESTLGGSERLNSPRTEASDPKIIDYLFGREARRSTAGRNALTLDRLPRRHAETALRHFSTRFSSRPIASATASTTRPTNPRRRGPPP